MLTPELSSVVADRHDRRAYTWHVLGCDTIDNALFVARNLLGNVGRYV